MMAPGIVAVTGATGFIGARLVQILAEGSSPLEPRIWSRRRSAKGAVDLRDPASVTAALTGCRALVHCAFDFADMDANLAIAQVLARACASAGVRLVHVSTVAVYEPLPDGKLDETATVEHPSSPYQAAKLAIETELLHQVRDAGLDVVILQPTIVYGPHGGAWTDSPIRELLTGTVVLPDQGEGWCNAVYVDDVCHAIIAAVTAELPSGERVLVSGSQPVTWGEFYRAYQAMLGVNALALEATDARAPGFAAAASAGDRSRLKARLKSAATRLLGARGVSRANLLFNYAISLVRARRHVATGQKLHLFRSRCDVQIGKARRLLGYTPTFDLERGMRSTRPYVGARYGRLARLKTRR